MERPGRHFLSALFCLLLAEGSHGLEAPGPDHEGPCSDSFAGSIGGGLAWAAAAALAAMAAFKLLNLLERMLVERPRADAPSALWRDVAKLSGAALDQAVRERRRDPGFKVAQGNESRILWHDSEKKSKTRLAVVRPPAVF